MTAHAFPTEGVRAVWLRTHESSPGVNYAAVHSCTLIAGVNYPGDPQPGGISQRTTDGGSRALPVGSGIDRRRLRTAEEKHGPGQAPSGTVRAVLEQGCPARLRRIPHLKTTGK